VIRRSRQERGTLNDLAQLLHLTLTLALGLLIEIAPLCRSGTCSVQMFVFSGLLAYAHSVAARTDQHACSATSITGGKHGLRYPSP